MSARKPAKKDASSGGRAKSSAPAADERQPSNSHRPVVEDMRFQRRQWQFERVGWAAMFLFVIASLAGVFGGGGPLQNAEASSADGMRVQYARFARYGAPVSMSVTVPATAGGGPIRLRFSEKYFDSMAVRSIVPAPATSAPAAGGQYVFVFERETARTPTPEPTTIYLQLDSKTPGSVSGWISLNDGTPVAISHFIYP